MNENEFEIEGATYVAADTDKPNSCEGCAFDDTTARCCDAPHCVMEDRADGRHVIFKVKG